MTDRREQLRRARLYLVCDERSDAFIEDALSGGVDIVQLRIKQPRSDQALITVARRFARVCDRHGALFILNDRPDLVAACGADGVHVGQDDVPVSEARAIVGSERLVGLSTHDPAQIDRADGEPLDYIGVGPVHATPTKPGRPAVGIGLVRYAAGRAGVPWFAIGGIDADNVRAVAEAGATQIAVVRAITEAADPQHAAAALRGALLGEGAGIGAT